MKPNFRLLSRFSLVLFIIGVSIGLSLSAGILWGELEVRVDLAYPPGENMKIKCPLLLAPSESGRIEAVITNTTTEEIQPTVIEDINRSGGSPVTSQIIPLGPTGSQTLAWTITSSDLMFNRLILVNIFQDQYRDNPSRLGLCGILVFSLFGLNGMQTFYLLFASSLTCILIGGRLWIYARQRMYDWSNLTQAAGLLGTLTVGALLSSIIHWWGLTLVFDSLILLLAITLLTEFFITQKVIKPTT